MSDSPDGQRARPDGEAAPATSLAIETDAFQIAVADTKSSTMIERLSELTGVNFDEYQQNYEAFAISAQNAIIATSFFDRLTDLRDGLATELVVGKIRGVEAWADGTDGSRLVGKSWSSFVDKIYRIDVEENNYSAGPPRVLNIHERAARAAEPSNSDWVTPMNGHLYVDDLVRTKFVVPFADGVVSVSAAIKSAAQDLGLPVYRRYHAKDSGYHAHHVYVLLPVPQSHGDDIEIAFEIKVLTKMQDTLGELTHLLYEYKRTGRLPSEKKRKLAWLFESADFTASYVGHTVHFVEASLVRLKSELADLEGIGHGKP